MPVEREESFDAERCCMYSVDTPYSVQRYSVNKDTYMKFYGVKDTIMIR